MKSSSPLSFLAMIARVAWGWYVVSQSSGRGMDSMRHLDRQKLTQGHA